MRSALWPDIEAQDAEVDARAWLQRGDAGVLVAERLNESRLGGFVEVGARAYADGCDTSPVAFLEGWYVDPDLRGCGVGRALVDGAIAWAREQGYAEMASDSLLEEVGAQRAHEAVGFVEVERAVRYRRVL